MFRLLQRLIGRNSQEVQTNIVGKGQAVLICLDGQSLPDDVYQACDIMTLEDLLSRKIDSDGNLGELDGHEVGLEGVTIYLYGPDAERLFEAVRPVLESYPLCRNSRVVIRQGGLGSSQREVTFPLL